MPARPRSKSASRSARPQVGDSPAPWTSVVVALASLALYAALAPVVPGDKDSGELTLVLATFGVAHPTGYPLYTLLGGAFVHAAHALGATWAQAANLWSALGGAVAIGALHALAARLLAPRVGARDAAAAAAIPLLAFALNPAWTQETTLAEVNSWHVAWVALAALAARSVLAGIGAGQSGVRGAVWWGAVVGAGLAHHLTSVLFAAPLTVAIVVAFVRTRAPGDTGRAAVAFAAGLAIPLGALGWIAWRAAHPAAFQWPALEAGARGLLDHVTGAQYQAFLGRFAPSDVQRARLAAHVYPWLVAAGIGAVAALAAHASRNEAWRCALAAGVLLQVAYAFGYGVSDPVPYFLPALAVGLPLLVDVLAGIAALRRHGRALGIAVALALAVPAAFGLRDAGARAHALAAFDSLLRRMWDALPAGPSFVVWDDDMAARLRAFQILEHRRPEAIVVQPRHLSHARPRREFTAAHGFDPLGPGFDAAAAGAAQGDAARSAALVDAIAGRINAESPLPVVLFLPAGPSMRQLTKPDSTAPGP